MVDPEQHDELDDALPDDVDTTAVLRDVQAVLEDLAGLELELESPEDLNLVRQALPTEPYRARFVHAALPIPLREALEYVRPSERQAGYWRRSRDRSTLQKLSDAELKHRHAFSTAARATREETGVVGTDDGRVIAKAANEIGEQLDGTEFRKNKPVDEEQGRRLFEKIVSAIK